MPELTFVTGNDDKFITCQHVCAKYGITLMRESPEIDEVQSEDSMYIACKKAEAAYHLLQRPLVVSDDTWEITSLNGFPGSYMKSMNHWLTVDDFLRLLAPMSDRSCTLRQYLVYQDGTEQKVFTNEVRGEILTEARGDISTPWTALVSLEGDNGLTIAEVRAAQRDRSDRGAADVWRGLLDWYTARPTT